ncbi:uncharacterized protein EAE97_001702 [Botrytis byssoidea]|uniref:Rhodopsin domain-containing protein n=1 Tax=Botrytis byssoidea TaxID=139641 RepID=A0A9P5ISD3_9HELO|nr:uncharacterized protein EAE97_001702 [Botrytis byssoidea]KAF7952205.1 hypothetical protein EAE97_001702 [Botrytis byssoidea]
MAVTPIQSLVSSLPPEVLAKIPAIAAPLGVTSNLVNPTSRGSVLAGIMIICYTIRVYTRLAIQRKVTWCDFTLLIGFRFGGLYRCSNMYVYLQLLRMYQASIDYPKAGTGDCIVGIHSWDISLLRLFSRRNLIALYIGTWMVYFALGFVKLSLFLMYLEIFVGLQWMKTCVYIGAMLSSLFYLAITVGHFCLATPFNGETWKSHIVSARTLKAITFSVPTAAVGLAIDVYLFILPFIAVIRLHLPMRKRIPAMMMFSVGLLACMGSALGIYYRVRFNRTDDMDIGIMLCCFLAMRLFLRTYRHTFSSVAVALASFLRCRLELSKSSAHITIFKDESTQESAITRPAPIKALGRNLYPNLDVTSPSDFEGSALSSKCCNGLSTKSAGENAFPIATHELRH